MSKECTMEVIVRIGRKMRECGLDRQADEVCKLYADGKLKLLADLHKLGVRWNMVLDEALHKEISCAKTDPTATWSWCARAPGHETMHKSRGGRTWENKG